MPTLCIASDVHRPHAGNKNFVTTITMGKIPKTLDILYSNIYLHPSLWENSRTSTQQVLSSIYIVIYVFSFTNMHTINNPFEISIFKFTIWPNRTLY